MSNIETPNPSSTVAAMPISSQPFQCDICQSRFTRHENLKRHAAVHTRSANKITLSCDFCNTTFSRLDLRRRHIRRKHPDKIERSEGGPKSLAPATAMEITSGSREPRRFSETSSAASYGQQAQQSPESFGTGIDNWLGHTVNPQPQPSDHLVDQRSVAQQRTTTYPRSGSSRDQDNVQLDHSLSLEKSSFGSNFSHTSHLRERMQTPVDVLQDLADVSSDNGSAISYIPDGLSSRDMAYLQDDWFPSPSQTTRGYQLYFANVTNFVPFIHRPTFDATETACHLGLSMLCLAYQYGEDPDCGERAGTGASLSLRCFHRARVLAAAEEERAGDLSSKITLVQTYWLLQVCVMMYFCGNDSAYGLKIHSRMISLTRFGGLTQPIMPQTATTEDLDELWRDFINSESHKRTLLAVHQIDALWYQLFSIPRSLSHLEIKHDLPCCAEYWTASSSSQWAHRQLAAKNSAPLVPYSDAVRCFLSPEPDIDALPKFDLYGVINIAQFLLSSAREVSGWSIMTGRLSLERFEPLQSSLIALERLIRPQAQKADSIHATCCEATWEIAMIELLIWSPSHTCGIVGGSVNAFLSHSTELAYSCKIVTEASAVSAVQPHVDWFLRYLDTTSADCSEPPWIDLYAYKAFLIAWQLLNESIAGAMQVVGIRDGDVVGAIAWAKKVFHRQQRPQLSRLFATCLDTLST